MKTWRGEMPGQHFRVYDKEESERLFGDLRRRIWSFDIKYETGSSYFDLDPEIPLFRNRDWACLLFPKALFDLIPDKEAKLMDGNQEPDDQYWDHTDFFRPFLDVINGGPEQTLLRAGRGYKDPVFEAPVHPADSIFCHAYSVPAEDVLLDDWTVFDRSGTWAFVNDHIDFCWLGGEVNLLRRYLKSLGGWRSFREKADRRFQQVLKGSSYQKHGVYNSYVLAGWRWPFGLEEIKNPFEYEIYEPFET